ncbi:class I SAM-dependent methyltransferase [Nocardioides sp.]|uniref:class I SAM-dependent methyltransferase n=1 Tax=Nocardioides sp. TaxID=35761 RepID=UPI002D808DEE|nr:class I SAM-dependent methyltransferase [Nocardioides sp.]HET8961964.1 class I SAM-dependent methyltransferase [Nocardioides sp.]
MDEEHQRLAHSFGSVAEAYDRGRPSFPREAVQWLVGKDPATVLEVGAGTGKLTEQLVALGHDVHATEPAEEMLEILRRNLPDTRATRASAEDLPVPDRSVDVVVAAQSFHWFDLEQALPEIARVLRPGGHLALVWNLRNEKIPWVRKLGTLIGNQELLSKDIAEPLVHSGLFGFVEDATFPFWQDINRQTIRDLVLSRSNIASLDEEARADKLAEVVAFYDDYGRGMDGMRLPYDSQCFRAAVVERPGQAPGDEEGDGPEPPRDAEPPTDGPDDGMLLIDFR